MSRPIAAVERTPFRLADPFALVGRASLVYVMQVGGIACLAMQAMRAMFKYRWDWAAITRQFFHIGNRSLPLIMLTGAFTGMVLGLQFAVGMRRFGLTLYTGQIVGLSLTRELGPVLAALMVAARVGSGIAAELGSMMVTEQVLAIEAMGANPVHRLVVPRMIAMLIATPLLAVVADAIGILGGMLITCAEAGVTAQFFMEQIWRTVGFDDFLHGIAKTVVFAFFIVMISCYQGLTTYGGTVGVGRATTRAVVFSSIVILISDFFLTKLFVLL